MATPYEQINNLDDIAIQAGTYVELELPCYYSDGEEMKISTMTYGCTLSVFGDSTVLQNISGTLKSGTSNVMVIKILSSYTENLGDCLLMYRPYVIDGINKYKWQGRLYIGATSPII